MNDDSPVIKPPEFSMMHAEPERLLERHRDFPGTVALVEELLPYYQHSLAAITSSATGAVPPKFTSALQGDYSHLPAFLAKETREHLGQLQASAFQIEASGDTKRAADIREVADQVYSMLKSIQQMSLHENVASTAAKAAHRRGGN